MTQATFRKSFTQQEPIPEDAIARAVEIMRSGRLHRYNVAPGETAEAALLEADFAKAVGAKYCLAVASGGYALATALRACGLRPGEPVLTNAFTLAPVPGSITGAGGKPVLVEITSDLVIDLDDLAIKARTSGARFLMLSLMRGHVPDMDAVATACNDLGLTMIEDCAHTMGAAWRGIPSGRFGRVGCYSAQTYKHINSGEGGLLVSDDAEVMARATMLSGSYMLFDRHIAGPSPDVFDDIRLDTPNCSGRMDNLRAAILRPQIERLGENRERWNALYRAVETGLSQAPSIVMRRRPQAETFVGSSIQFRCPHLGEAGIKRLVADCGKRGVDLKWFGAAAPSAFTSRHDSWRYIDHQSLPQTDEILSRLLDMRLPLTFNADDGRLIASIIVDCLADIDRDPNAKEARS